MSGFPPAEREGYKHKQAFLIAQVARSVRLPENQIMRSLFGFVLDLLDVMSIIDRFSTGVEYSIFSMEIVFGLGNFAAHLDHR